MGNLIREGSISHKTEIAFSHEQLYLLFFVTPAIFIKCGSGNKSHCGNEKRVDLNGVQRDCTT